MKVIIFSDSDDGRLQEVVNEWLAENEYHIKVDRIFQSESYDDSIWNLTISIWYFEK